jgi:hypothetical protein
MFRKWVWLRSGSRRTEIYLPASFHRMVPGSLVCGIGPRPAAFVPTTIVVLSRNPVNDQRGRSTDDYRADQRVAVVRRRVASVRDVMARIRGVMPVTRMGVSVVTAMVRSSSRCRRSGEQAEDEQYPDCLEEACLSHVGSPWRWVVD